MRYRRLLFQSVDARRFVILLSLLLVIITLLVYNKDYDRLKRSVRQATEEQARRTHFAVIDAFMKDRESWNTSILGSWLFKYDSNVMPRSDRTFTVHVNQLISSRNNSLQNCSVKNCIFTSDDILLREVDAVLVNLRYGIIPTVNGRRPNQRWIFLNDDSPKHAFYVARKNMKLKDLANVFNWSMTYRSDSDIPVPYGRTVPLEQPVFKNYDVNILTEIIPYWKIKRRDVLTTILFTQCSVKIRANVIEALQKYIPVDVYGKCSKNDTLALRCPGRYIKDCSLVSEYLFYLSLENSDCREYMTEKIWYNAYMQGAIPIIMGPPLSDCKRLLPPDSFLYISSPNNYTELEELAKRIIQLNENDDSLLSFHKWRNHFVVINEQGYTNRKSNLLCRLCEGLNYNDKSRKIYTETDIRQFIGPRLSCGNKNA